MIIAGKAPNFECYPCCLLPNYSIPLCPGHSPADSGNEMGDNGNAGSTDGDDMAGNDENAGSITGGELASADQNDGSTNGGRNYFPSPDATTN